MDNKKYYQENRERKLANAKKWHEIHKQDPAWVQAKRDYHKKWYEKNKGTIRTKRVTPEYLENKRKWANSSRLKKLEEVAGRPRPVNCEICGGTNKIYFDHDHSTGAFRGWICMSCNTALGHARDNTALLYKLIHYLEASRASPQKTLSPIQLKNLTK